MERKTYNGWTNYETWNVKLWIDNDQDSYNEWRDCARECLDVAEADETFTREDRAAFRLADLLKDRHEEDMPTLTGPYCDLLRAALSEVNWDEIARSMIGDMVEA